MTRISADIQNHECNATVIVLSRPLAHVNPQKQNPEKKTRTHYHKILKQSRKTD
jgi:hypothetical protein